MHELLERLGRGDARVLAQCAAANRAWSDFFTELETADVGTVSARLGFFQPTVEKIFESKTLGETMMAWTAFANLYDTKSGWGVNQRRAQELIVAFANSNCTAEVKEEARSAAISYGLDRAPPNVRQEMRR
ncbi:MAG TPA: hypothetical protein VG841_16185 [Caulobacterales bacterium]|nr:hypothetical protein [Caulobacterales bacterium]